MTSIGLGKEKKYLFLILEISQKHRKGFQLYEMQHNINVYLP
jgi:hypothetical protein